MRNDRRLHRVPGALPLGLLLAACSGHTVDLGGEGGDTTVEVGEVCGASGFATGNFAVTDQSGLAELTGCREIDGSLLIGLFDADFTPLRELRRVRGDLTFGQVGFENLSVTDLILLGEGPVSPDDLETLLLDPMTPAYRSLAGLESLESVENLRITRVGATNLAPLARLQTVTRNLNIENCALLRDLSGLEQLRDVGGLQLFDNPELVSLQGLAFLEPWHIDYSVYLTNLPRLSNIQGLAGLTSVGASLEVNGTALQNLDALSHLSTVADYLTLRDNAALIDLSGLDNLTTVGVLEIENNDALRRAPEFRSLQSFGTFAVNFNDALEEFDLAMPAFLHANALAGSTWYAGALEAISVGDNSKLERFAISPRVSLINHIFINRNASLKELDLGGAADLGVLTITDNQRLDTIVAPDLKTIRELGVKRNPQLSMSFFADVKTAITDARDNAPQAGP